MIKTRQPARRQTRVAAAPTPAPITRLVQPTVLDDKQLKQVAGGTSDPQALPKGGW